VAALAGKADSLQNQHVSVRDRLVSAPGRLVVRQYGLCRRGRNPELACRMTGLERACRPEPPPWAAIVTSDESSWAAALRPCEYGTIQGNSIALATSRACVVERQPSDRPSLPPAPHWLRRSRLGPEGSDPLRSGLTLNGRFGRADGTTCSTYVFR